MSTARKWSGLGESGSHTGKNHPNLPMGLPGNTSGSGDTPGPAKAGSGQNQTPSGVKRGDGTETRKGTTVMHKATKHVSATGSSKENSTPAGVSRSDGTRAPKRAKNA